MQHSEYILEALGATHLSDEQKTQLLEQIHTLVGEAISTQLTEEQLKEYQAIIDDRKLVIELWLKQHLPEYKNSVAYQEIVAAAKQDPEHNNPEKIFANLAWIKLNVPDIKKITDTVIQDFKTQHFSHPAA
jgi:hypothetical protein